MTRETRAHAVLIRLSVYVYLWRRECENRRDAQGMGDVSPIPRRRRGDDGEKKHFTGIRVLETERGRACALRERSFDIFIASDTIYHGHG